ncbi:MAG: ABC transporter substrate-binding protein [Hyphomicrobiaceae bacterium]
MTAKVNTYDPLFRWYGVPAELKPHLATEATASADGLVYTVKLRKGVKFQDMTEVTADDVVYSVERVLALNRAPARFFSPLIAPGTTRAIDRYTVEFKLKQPAAPFAGMLSELYVVNKALIQQHEKDGDWGVPWVSKNPAGSGPFRVTEYDPATGWYAERFKDYFLGWGDKAVDGIRMRTIREPNSQVLALSRGTTDMYMNVLSNDQADRLRKSPNVVVHDFPHQRIFVVHMHNQRPPLNDVHVRRAISYAFDYQGLIDGVLGGKAQRIQFPLPPSMWGYPKTEGYTYNLDKAKAELAKAQVKIDRPLQIHAQTGNRVSEQVAQVLQASLRKIGIEANIVSEPWSTLASKCRSAETAPDFFGMWKGPDYPDPHNWLGDMYDSRNGASYTTCSFYKNKDVDAALSEAFRLPDQNARRVLYEKAAQQIVDDAGSLFLFNLVWQHAMNKRVHGYEFTPVALGHNVKPVWLDK